MAKTSDFDDCCAMHRPRAFAPALLLALLVSAVAWAHASSASGKLPATVETQALEFTGAHVGGSALPATVETQALEFTGARR